MKKRSNYITWKETPHLFFRHFIIITLLSYYVFPIAYAQKTDISASFGPIIALHCDIERANNIADINVRYRTKNNYFLGGGLSYIKSSLKMDYPDFILLSSTWRNTISPHYDRHIYSMFISTGYEIAENDNFFITPHLDCGISWIKANFNDISLIYNEEGRLRPHIGLGCDFIMRGSRFGLSMGIQYCCIFDRHTFNTDEIPIISYTPSPIKMLSLFGLKTGLVFYLGDM